MSRFTLPAILTAAALAVGCTGTVRSHGTITASTYSPDLVYVSPGVSVIADYNEPVFYSDNYYWRYTDDGRWYRSSYYDRGWSYASPPRAVLSINRPMSYRHYRPTGYTVRRDTNRGRTYDRGYDRRGYDRRDDRRGRPVIRDHRR